MNGGSRIIAFGSSEGDGTEGQKPDELDLAEVGTLVETEEDTAEEAAAWTEPDEEAQLGGRPIGGLLPAFLALAATAVWTGFFIWAHLPEFVPAMAPASVAGLITDWAVPVLLIGVLWLLAMRHSTREAARFGDAARLLSHQSDQLEARLLIINRELSLAREFLASETRDLEALGRVATERLSQHADKLQDLVRDNGARVETIGQVSETALGNMEKLRGQLPVIASSAKDVTNNIGNAGRTAHNQIEEMIRGFSRINEFGQACEKQVFALRDIVDETLAGFSEQCGQLEHIAAARFAELNERGSEFRTQLEKQEVDALCAIRSRAAALAEELEQTRARLDSDEEACLESLRVRLASLRDEGGTISRSLREGEEQALEGWRMNIGQIEETRSALFSRIEQSDNEAIEAARNRLGAISAEAELIEAGIAERSAKLVEDLEARRDLAEQAEREALARFSELFAALDAEISQRSEAHERHGAALAEQVEALIARLGQSDGQMAEIAARAKESEERISASLQGIASKVGEAQKTLAGTESAMAELTDSSVRLLELIQASGEQSRAELPNILAQSQEGLTASETRAREIRDALKQAGKNGEWLANQIEGSGATLKSILEDITRMQFGLRNQAIAHQETLADLGKSLKQLENQSDQLSQKARTDLAEAIGKLENSAREAVAVLAEQGTAGVAAIAEQLGEASAEAVDKVLRAKTAEASGQLEQAAAQAAGVSREAAIQLRDQLAKVDELVGNLENRVTRARERAEEQVDNDFARRAALITEALNSNAIDIAKALSTDVSDTAWEGYLRGDRGIFTRRAVSLIDGSEAKAIQHVFERDPDFREHVSRYIHDFEAILRQVLSTRDGHALGVTLLSSDMGKLYVALAQAIERLRN